MTKKSQKLCLSRELINKVKGKIEILEEQLRALEEGLGPSVTFDTAAHLARVRPKNKFGEKGIEYRGSMGNPRYNVRLKEKGKVRNFGTVSTIQEARELSKREQSRIKAEKISQNRHEIKKVRNEILNEVYK